MGCGTGRRTRVSDQPRAVMAGIGRFPARREEAVQVTATVMSDRSPAAAGSQVIVFSTDRARWYSESRFFRTGATAGDGRVSFTGLPEGGYFAIALRALPPGSAAWQDGEFLDGIRNDATVITVADGQPEALELALR